MTNTIEPSNSWELIRPTSTTIRYQNLASGEIITRYEYDKRVANGQIVKSVEGSTNWRQTVTYFEKVGTRHRTISSNMQNLTSIKAMANAHKAPGALPPNTSVSMRLYGDISVADSTGQTIQKSAIQTRMWSTVTDALSELLDILDDVRNANISSSLGVNVHFEPELAEVIYREII